MATVAAVRARRLILAGVLAAAFGASPASATTAAHLRQADDAGRSATSAHSGSTPPSSAGAPAKPSA